MGKVRRGFTLASPYLPLQISYYLAFVILITMHLNMCNEKSGQRAEDSSSLRFSNSEVTEIIESDQLLILNQDFKLNEMTNLSIRSVPPYIDIAQEKKLLSEIISTYYTLTLKG